MTRFQKITWGLALLVHAPWTVALVAALLRTGWAPGWPLLCGACALGLSLWLLAGRLRWVMHDAPRSRVRVWAVELPYFVHLGALVLAFFPALLVLGLALAKLLPWTALSLWYAASYVGAAYSVLWRRWHFVVREFDVELPNWPRELDGLRVAHLSDLHVGGLMRRDAALRWARATALAKPDLVLLTGDYVTSGVAFHDEIAEVIGALSAPHGVFATMGNHDYFGDGEPLLSKLRARGVTVLRNQNVTLELRGKKLQIAGTDDVWTRRADVPLALEGWDGVTPLLLLAHDPVLFSLAAARKVPLTLAGHTHGGQLALPFLGRWASLSHLAHPYHVGLYREADSTLYVSPGLGTTGLPMRVGTTPTVAILRLRAA